MNWPGWYRAIGVPLERAIIVILLAALLGGAFIASYPEYVCAAGNVSITRQLFSPSANVAVTGGDNNGFETTPANAYADGGGSALDTDSGAKKNEVVTDTGTDKHNYYNYGIDSIPIPTNSTINGITVRADIAVDSTANSPFTAIRLSWDGGTSWTAVKQLTLTAIAETTYTYGGTADNWGRTWSVSELSNTNFRVQVINGDTNTGKSICDFSLDWIPVSLTFTAPWDSYEDSDRTTVRDTFDSNFPTVYMRGTAFTAGNYNVSYYDAAGQEVHTHNNIPDASGILDSYCILNQDWGPIPENWPTVGIWHALVQPTGGTAFPSDYNTAVNNPDTYNLIANDSFTVELSAIPEFSTVIAGIVVAGMCFGIYYWMRKRAKLKMQSAN